MKRFGASVLALSLFGALNSSQVAAAESQGLQKLTIGYPALATTLATIAVIQKAGLFKKYSLDVDLVFISGSPLLTAAMVSGQVPLSFVGAPAVVASAVGGAETVLLSCAISMAYGRLFAVPEVKTLSQLKGKKIGITRLGTIDDAILRYTLKQRANISDREVAFLSGGGASERLIALTKGAIDATVLAPPQDSIAEKSGLNELVDLNKIGLYNPASCIASTKPYARKNRDTIIRVLKGFVEGLKFLRENRNFALKVFADFTRTSDKEALSAGYDLTIHLQDKVPYVNMKGMEFLLQITEARDPRAKNFDPAALVDSSFMQELEKSGFIDSVLNK
ncbi:MAG TPA: ABC transporter substrate-binding protein [Candidatus Binatia bacterium]|jgi:NitT/TauT family transport system substrate-binding protein